jgi:hypothetical protein
VIRHFRGFEVHDFLDASEHRLSMTTIAPSGRAASEVIEVALVIDSSLCARIGGSSERFVKALLLVPASFEVPDSEDADLSIHGD